MRTPCVDIVIVNWNTGTLLSECLRSIAADVDDREYIGGVIVVDNGSTDGSLEATEGLNLPMTIVRNRANKGFAAACNQGAFAGRARYILFLNPDTRLASGTLDKVARWMEAPENAWIGVCTVQLLDDAGQTTRTCCRFPTARTLAGQALGLDRLLPKWFPPHFLSQAEHTYSHRVDQVIGAFFFVRREMFQRVRGFDERFFVYFEELDLSYRLAVRGWQSYFLASACSYHKGHGSSNQVRATRLFYSWRSRLLYCFKHFAPLSALGIVIVTVLLEPLVRIIAQFLNRCHTQLNETVAASLHLARSVPLIIWFAATGKGREYVTRP
jgi:N-acetylglucosaminyl-diphospho-decaprenol L-rhamnosyltransferase